MLHSFLEPEVLIEFHPLVKGVQCDWFDMKENREKKCIQNSEALDDIVIAMLHVNCPLDILMVLTCYSNQPHSMFILFLSQ